MRVALLVSLVAAAGALLLQEPSEPTQLAQLNNDARQDVVADAGMNNGSEGKPDALLPQQETPPAPKDESQKMNAATDTPQSGSSNLILPMGSYEPVLEEPQPVLDWPYPYAKGFPTRGLLIAVVTAPTHVRARQAFRRNWDLLKRTLPSQDLAGIDMKFFIGQLDPENRDYNKTKADLEGEQKKTGDIVRLNGFVETYRNLTLKTMNIVTWAHYQRYGGMFKVDDDTFLRLDNFLEFLKAEMNPRMIYAGYFVSDVRVITDPPSSKWFCDRYPYDVFPDYASGPGYFIGGAVMEFLVTNQNQLVDYQIEDAAMGIWTQKMAGIDRVNLRTSAYVSYCEDGPDLIWVNPLEPDEMERVADNVLRGDMCLNYQTLNVCHKNPCLCTPRLDDCYEENGEAWHNYSSSPYSEDTSRLLLQTEEGSGLTEIRQSAISKQLSEAATLR